MAGHVVLLIPIEHITHIIRLDKDNNQSKKFMLRFDTRAVGRGVPSARLIKSRALEVRGLASKEFMKFGCVIDMNIITTLLNRGLFCQSDLRHVAAPYLNVVFAGLQ